MSFGGWQPHSDDILFLDKEKKIRIAVTLSGYPWQITPIAKVHPYPLAIWRFLQILHSVSRIYIIKQMKQQQLTNLQHHLSITWINKFWSMNFILKFPKIFAAEIDMTTSELAKRNFKGYQLMSGWHLWEFSNMGTLLFNQRTPIL